METLSLKEQLEILEAYKKTGYAIRKKDEVHKMAEANKAFAKYRF